MNETIYRQHYSQATRGQRKPFDDDKARRVHKALCAAIGAKGTPTAAGGMDRYRSEVRTAAEKRLRAQYGSISGFILWPVIWALLRPILEAMLPLIIEWLVEQAMSGRMSGDTVRGLKEWGEA
jgi:hypothetical protein